MAKFKPATISNGSFVFCRASVAILLWISILLQLKWLVAVVFFIMILSAIFKVEKAPLILVYKYTLEKVKPSNNVIVDETGIYVSHLVGGIFAGFCLLLLYFKENPWGWIVTALFAILQTSAAFGFCSALKLYTCMAGGNCCRFGKYAKKVKERC